MTNKKLKLNDKPRPMLDFDGDEFNVFETIDEEIARRKKEDEECLKNRKKINGLNHKIPILTDQELKRMRARWRRDEKLGISRNMSEVD